MGLRSLQWRFSDFRGIIKEPQFARFTGILVAQEFSCFHEILPLQQAHWKPEQPAEAGRCRGATFPKLQGARRIGCESYHFGNENSCHSPTWIGGQTGRQIVVLAPLWWGSTIQSNKNGLREISSPTLPHPSPFCKTFSLEKPARLAAKTLKHIQIADSILNIPLFLKLLILGNFH